MAAYTYLYLLAQAGGTQRSGARNARAAAQRRVWRRGERGAALSAARARTQQQRYSAFICWCRARHVARRVMRTCSSASRLFRGGTSIPVPPWRVPCAPGACACCIAPSSAQHTALPMRATVWQSRASRGIVPKAVMFLHRRRKPLYAQSALSLNRAATHYVWRSGWRTIAAAAQAGSEIRE